ncbi:hypothetical protein DRE_07323 [Drechslerella stenobrocha 248]|uniref:Aminotransferase class I/classII large domain-containing protein n=1 Tax=Drechslerella stenobrocha 248 TaxID=1043628 RepID=W7HL83_9PEZI|nr:hypothetical protein DRE_07323 [Drechslerella stenobrocha 248]
MHMDANAIGFGLSQRGLVSLGGFAGMADLMRIFQNMYNKETNPNGIVSLGVAENSLMHKELTEFLHNKVQVTPYSLTYGEGPGGSSALRKALAEFYNRKLNPAFEIEPDHISTASGVSGVLDLLCHAIAEEGEAIMIGRPIYTGFKHDLFQRSKLKLVPVSLKGVDPMGPEAVELYEKELQRQKELGVKVRAVILCNPHNPLGKCYTPEVIRAYAKFCNAHQIHFISDEIYALSIYSTPSNATAAPFTSVFSIPDLREIIAPHLVHVLHGMSKDFCANGLRMGTIISPWNALMRPALMSVGLFQWVSSVADIAWRTVLEDTAFLDEFVASNQRKLGVQYQLLEAWLRARDIPFVEGGNAGFFVWVDLRRYLDKVKLPDGDDGSVPGGESNLPPAPPGLQKRDKILWDKMVDSGVYVATAEMFYGEEHGWYRFSFSIVEEELQLGLARMDKVLKEVEEKGLVGKLEELTLGTGSDGLA